MNPIKRTAHLAGLTYLVAGVGTFFGFLCAPLVGADSATLAKLVTVSEARFRFGIASDLVCNVLNVLLVVLLYDLLKRVHQLQAVLMAVLLLVSVPISFVITVVDVAARELLQGGEAFATFGPDQLEALGMLLLRMHVHGVYAVEVFWGLWLVPLGLLVFRSRFLPRTLGVLVIVAGVAYTAHSLVSVLVPEQRTATYEIATMVGRIGEILLILWLTIRGLNEKLLPGDAFAAPTESAA